MWVMDLEARPVESHQAQLEHISGAKISTGSCRRHKEAKRNACLCCCLVYSPQWGCESARTKTSRGTMNTSIGHWFLPGGLLLSTGSTHQCSAVSVPSPNKLTHLKCCIVATIPNAKNSGAR
jgi:hypothetical protein